MRSRKRQEYMSYLSIITTIIYCSIIWFGVYCFVYNIKNPELTQIEVIINVIKIIL
jgi:hypothetical protein